MSDEQLTMEIVSNEKLGIGKKPSVFKIIFVILFLCILGFMSYTFFIKSQDSEKPDLDLGQPIGAVQPQNNTPAVAQTPTELVSQPFESANQGAIQPAPVAEQPMPQPMATNQPAQATGQTPAPLNNVYTPTNATQGVTNVVSANTSQVAQNPLPSAPNPQPVTPVIAPAEAMQPSPQAINAQPEIKLVASESEVAPAPKKVIRKPARKVTPQKPKPVIEEPSVQAIPVEEGVTREEIIVIQ